MKKNGEFVGVDEKYIPENEKYVDESLLGDREKSKKAAKRFAKGYLIFFVIFFVFVIGFSIVNIIRMNDKTNSFQTNNFQTNKYTFSNLQGTQSAFDLKEYLDDIITNNKLDAYTKITVVYNGKSATTEDELLVLKNELNNTGIDAYEVSVDYADSLGQAINKVTIKDIK